MVYIGSSDKIINLWPAPPSRPIEKSGHKKKSLKDQAQKQQQKNEKEITDDGPGKNIDEFV